MASLHTAPGSSTAKQRTALVIAARKHGLDLAETRRMVGGSLKTLSAAQASDWIKRFTGRDLPNPPGEKPSPYAGKKATPGVTRMITGDQADQIKRQMLEYFDDDWQRAAAWLHTDFGVRYPLGLATAKRAGEVIRVLKTMLKRRKDKLVTRNS